MAAEWFLKVGNQVHGPMSAAELRQKAAAGLIGPETPIRKGPDGQWVRAEKVRGLFSRGDSLPLPPPPNAPPVPMDQKTTCPKCKQLFEVSGESLDTTVSCPACNHRFNPMKELVKEACKRTNTPEFQAHFLEHVIEENKAITHADFVIGMRNRVIGVACLGQGSRLLVGARKTVFILLAVLYQIGPLLLVPLWAYHERNWWLLIGIAVSWVATARTANSAAVVLKGKTVGGFLGFLCLVSWISLGIHNWFTFFSLCAMWGCLLFQMAEAAEQEYATCLVENPELFDWAMVRGMITISRRWDKPPYEDWQDGEPDRAIAGCTNAIRLGLRWPGMYLDRGRAHAAKGEHDKAIADYTEAIHLDPKDADAYLWRRIAYEAKGEHDNATRDFGECKRLRREAWGALQHEGRPMGVGPEAPAPKPLARRVVSGQQQLSLHERAIAVTQSQPLARGAGRPGERANGAHCRSHASRDSCPAGRPRDNSEHPPLAAPSRHLQRVAGSTPRRLRCGRVAGGGVA